MRKQDLHALAAVGMVEKLRGIEQQLADALREFPDVCCFETVPALVRPELRNGHSADWPIVVKKRQTQGHLRAQRELSARLLHTVETAEKPMSRAAIAAAGHNPKAIGVLVANGYLKLAGDGYRRTKKAYRADVIKGGA